MAKALHIPRCWQKLSFLYGTIIALLFATLCWTSATAEIVLRPGASGGVNASDISETRLPTYDFFQRQQSPFKQTGLALFVHFDDGCELQLPGSRTSGNVENASSLIVVVNNTIYKSLCGSFNEIRLPLKYMMHEMP
ncbi:hypothetical protein BDF19DRAFT_46657 [Syncephalis fuscata]|nr:hypothetical protein BDF19DRAFT_46657 [Syncephalis fuscata]